MRSDLEREDWRAGYPREHSLVRTCVQIIVALVAMGALVWVNTEMRDVGPTNRAVRAA